MGIRFFRKKEGVDRDDIRIETQKNNSRSNRFSSKPSSSNEPSSLTTLGPLIDDMSSSLEDNGKESKKFK
jgi:hypothetical protein